MLRTRAPSGPPVETEVDKPLFKTYRPAPSAHSKHLHVRPNPNSSLAFAPVARAKFRKEHKAANDTAALDRLLSPEFQSHIYSGRDSLSSAPTGHQGGILTSATQLGPTTSSGNHHSRTSFDAADRGAGHGAGGGGSSSRLGPLRRSGSGKGAGDRDYLHHRASGGSGGGLASNLTEKIGVKTSHHGGDGSGRPERERLRSRLGSGKRRPGSGATGRYDDDDGQEDLTAQSLGVYIDESGRLHDKEYDPFEKVRVMSRRKVEKRRAFGASRDEESETGSEDSASLLGGGGGGGGFAGGYGRRYQHRGFARPNPIQERYLYDDDDGDDASSSRAHSFRHPGQQVTSSSQQRDHRSGTHWSEYDSGVSATSPRGPASEEATAAASAHHHHSTSSQQQHIDSPLHSPYPTTAANGFDTSFSPSASSSSHQPHHPPRRSATSFMGGGGSSAPTTSSNNPHALKSQPASMKTTTSHLARLEERPRSLLFPATPAQLAAQRDKEKRSLPGGDSTTTTATTATATTGRGLPSSSTRRAPSRMAAADSSMVAYQDGLPTHPRDSRPTEATTTLRPPVAPFNPQFSTTRRRPSSSTSSSLRAATAGGGGTALTKTRSGGGGETSGGFVDPTGQYHHHHHAHLVSGAKSTFSSHHQRASSSVFSGHDMGYLPSRWAKGEREFRAGEEELERYRPMEFRGTREDQMDPEWTPGTMDQIKRNWREIALAIRFSTHRAAKKVERKVRNI